MEPIKALFTSTPGQFEAAPGQYKKDKAYWLTPAQYDRWSRRGRVEVAPESMETENDRPSIASGSLNPKVTDADTDPSLVEIPANWDDLPWPALKALAAQVSATAVVSKVDATGAIESELARRALLQLIEQSNGKVLPLETRVISEGVSVTIVTAPWPDSVLLTDAGFAALPKGAVEIEAQDALAVASNGSAVYRRTPHEREKEIGVLLVLQPGSTFNAPEPAQQ